MLPLIDLDDRYFEDLVRDAKKMIPSLLPAWTDENDHDPGITLIELFSWLMEMQTYYMNRISVDHERKFLQLLGVHLAPKCSAKVNVAFSHAGKEVIVPIGTRLKAHDLIFETEKEFSVVPNKIEQVLVYAHSEMHDYTVLNDSNQSSFHAFGKEDKKGHTLYIGFEKPMVEHRKFKLDVFMDEFTHIDEQMNRIPSVQLAWKFLGQRDVNGQWKKTWLPLKVVEDTTNQLSNNGHLVIELSAPMQLEKLQKSAEKARYWLSCTIMEGRYENTPRINQITLNCTNAIHHKTLSEPFLFHSNGEKNQEVTINHFLSLYGEVTVQVKEANGLWRYWHEVDDFNHSSGNDTVFLIKRDFSKKITSICFSDGIQGKIPKKGEHSIRVICYEDDFELSRMVGSSNGLPNQIFEFGEVDLIQGNFQLQVGRKLKGYDELLWEDWMCVDDFHNSESADPHFILEEETGKIFFGNNEKGIIPQKSEIENICVIQCKTGGGEKGNIKQNLMEELEDPDKDVTNLTIYNIYPAFGGSERETVELAKERFQRSLEVQQRAVTVHDFEEMVMNIPGIKVGRVKAIPLYQIGMKDYPQNKALGKVTLVVIPKNEEKNPVPGDGFLQTIKSYVSQYRLVTTDIQVVAPEYIKVSVQAVVVVEPYLKDDPTRIEQALERALQPLNYPFTDFGKPVYKGDIYSLINDVEGVVYIKDLWIEAEGKGVFKEQSGNIHIPPHGLIYSGKHHIEVVSRTDL